MRGKRLRVVIPVALVALLAVFALVGALVSGDRNALTSAASTSAERASAGAAEGDAGTNEALDTAKASGNSDQPTGETYAAVPPAATPSTHYLIRNGSLTLTVQRRDLREAMQRIGTITLGMGGYVLSSYIGSETPWLGTVEPKALDDTAVSSGAEGDIVAGVETKELASDSGDVVQYGTITVRVPAAKFDTAVERFADLGEVVDMTTSADDVSSQMVDLRARLRHARAVDERLVGFLDQARTVRETLAVQDRIDANQLTIEQLTAEIVQMSEITSYGTITVSLHERGVPQPGSIDESDTFWGAFTHSLRLIAHGAKTTAVAMGALLPFLALIGVVAVAAWYGRRAIARRRPPQAPLPES